MEDVTLGHLHLALLFAIVISKSGQFAIIGMTVVGGERLEMEVLFLRRKFGEIGRSPEVEFASRTCSSSLRLASIFFGHAHRRQAALRVQARPLPRPALFPFDKKTAMGRRKTHAIPGEPFQRIVARSWSATRPLRLPRPEGRLISF